MLSGLPKAELLWASVREVLNIFQAADCGCHIVTVPHDILGKASQAWWNGFEGVVSRHRANVLRGREAAGFKL